MKKGLVVGKFYPLHAGHQYLIEEASMNCDQLTIVVVGQDEQMPSTEMREGWLKELYPDDVVISVPDIYNDDSSSAWADYTVEILGEAPDIVFTSEEYGSEWAKYLGCEHMLVDIERKSFPVSGTTVRDDPIANWRYLSRPVREHYTRRVCVLGAESTGTTTLTEALAKEYKTTWVPEYGRTYTYGKVTANEEGAEWTSQEFEFIADQQNIQEDQMARFANKMLFCDTDSFATAVWHERYMGFWSDAVERLFAGRNYDLYILTDIDIPFEQDGIRDGEHIRLDMHKRFIELLKKYDKRFIIASGSIEERVKLAKTTCDGILEESGL